MSEELFCLNCGKQLIGRQTKYCSKECKTEVLGTYYNREKNQISQNKKRLERKLYLLEKYDFKCSNCGYDKNLSALEFHHLDPSTKLFQIDGKNLTSKSIESIFLEAEKCILLCANCHRELHHPTNTLEIYKSTLDSYNESFIKYNKKEIIKEIPLCEQCGKEHLDSTAKLCIECYRLNSRKVERPSKEELLELIKTNSFVALGKKYNVTDNAVKKWCISYDIPSKKKDLRTLGLIK